MAIKLFPPDADVELYQEGFGTSDLLGRKSVGEKLSSLVEGIETPVVIALEGPWGSGKTHFLRRWVGAHRLENKGIAQTIYFDAFQSDYLEDPLVAITGAIGERIGTSSKSIWKKMKGAAFKLAKPVSRIGLAMASYGATELAAATVDVAVEATTKELEKAADDFWKKEDGRRAAMEQLRAALTTLTKTEGGHRPLVVVIDELDRCRPDYALSVLEVIKHFFTVPFVHFVLGVNSAALQDSVRVRYGASFNAEEYLRRFITLSIRLPDRTGNDETSSVGLLYFREAARSMELPDGFIKTFDEHLAIIMRRNPVSIRDLGRVLTHLALLMTGTGFKDVSVWGWREMIISMTLMKVLAPGLYRKAVSNQLSVAEVSDFYGITEGMVRRDAREEYIHMAAIIRGIWELAITGDVSSDEKEEFYKAFDRFGDRSRAKIAPRHIAKEYLDWPIVASTST